MERGESRSPFDGAPFDRLRAGRTNGVGVIRPSTGSLRLAQGGQDERPGRSVLLRPFDFAQGGLRSLRQAQGGQDERGGSGSKRGR